mmetsp:Transcript_69942/g.191973  ORF Transcript_69942/g.191973 Transcript_69942/m.191973 type:complete len:298 (+) Transcript_69942:78-971(+)
MSPRILCCWCEVDALPWTARTPKRRAWRRDADSRAPIRRHLTTPRHQCGSYTLGRAARSHPHPGEHRLVEALEGARVGLEVQPHTEAVAKLKRALSKRAHRVVGVLVATLVAKRHASGSQRRARSHHQRHQMLGAAVGMRLPRGRCQLRPPAQPAQPLRGCELLVRDRVAQPRVERLAVSDARLAHLRVVGQEVVQIVERRARSDYHHTLLAQRRERLPEGDVRRGAVAAPQRDFDDGDVGGREGEHHRHKNAAAAREDKRARCRLALARGSACVSVRARAETAGETAAVDSVALVR